MTAQVVVPTTAKIGGQCSGNTQTVVMTWDPATNVHKRRRVARDTEKENVVTLTLFTDGDTFHIKNIVGRIVKDPRTFPNASSSKSENFIV